MKLLSIVCAWSVFIIAGCSGPRDPVGPDTQAPSAPTGVTVALAAPTELLVVWQAATDNVGVVEYTVFRDDSPVDTVSGGVLTFSDTSLLCATEYCYYVIARDGAGNESPTSDTRRLYSGACMDVERPWVESFFPPDDSLGVKVDIEITVTFSELIDTATITASTFFLQRPDFTKIPGEVSYD